MRFPNPVKSHKAPWFMDEAQTARQLPKLPDHVKPYVEEPVRDGVTPIKGAVPKVTCAALIERFKALAAANTL